MLDSHPRLAIPAETGFVPKLIERARSGAQPGELAATVTEHWRWPDLGLDADELRARFRAGPASGPADAVRTVFRLYAERQGKPRWGDKTPAYVRRIESIAEVLPEARFVHVIRDGRDVALSRMGTAAMGHDSIEQAARSWKRAITRARRHGLGADRYLEVRYEQLVADPRTGLDSICRLLELQLDEAMLDPSGRAAERLGEMATDRSDVDERDQVVAERAELHRRVASPPDTTRVERWRREMSEQDLCRFEAVAGDCLRELGYPTSS